MIIAPEALVVLEGVMSLLRADAALEEKVGDRIKTLAKLRDNTVWPAVAIQYVAGRNVLVLNRGERVMAHTWWRIFAVDQADDMDNLGPIEMDVNRIMGMINKNFPSIGRYGQINSCTAEQPYFNDPRENDKQYQYLGQEYRIGAQGIPMP